MTKMAYMSKVKWCLVARKPDFVATINKGTQPACAFGILRCLMSGFVVRFPEGIINLNLNIRAKFQYSS